MTNNNFIEKAKKEVIRYYRDTTPVNLTIDDVFIVWMCKTLQNYKAIMVAKVRPVDDRKIFEVTYNGDKHECYLDVYEKEENRCIAWRDDE